MFETATIAPMKLTLDTRNALAQAGLISLCLLAHLDKMIAPPAANNAAIFIFFLLSAIHSQ